MTAREKLDPRLRVLLRRREEQSASKAALSLRLPLSVVESVTDEAAPPAEAPVEVLLRCDRYTEGELEAYGAVVHARIGGSQNIAGEQEIVSAALQPDLLAAMSEETWVHEIEAARHLFSELDLSIAEVRAGAVHNGNPSIRGAGVLVGVIDGGIDFRHADFRNGGGTSRIRLLWDQNAQSDPAGTVPFGRVFTKTELDAIVAGAPGAAPITPDSQGHGTHVAGIAAGNGRSAAPPKFTGVAPDAEYLIVISRGDAPTLGQSNAALAAFTWIADRAAELGRPVAINHSQGMNGGGHAGESLLEVGMDLLARKPGLAIVKSAGNEQTWRTHAGGSLAMGSTAVVEFAVTVSNTADDILELWHDGADVISVAVQPPGAAAPAPADFFAPGSSNVRVTAAANSVTVDSSLDSGGTGDVRTVIFVSKANAPRIQPGTWRLHLRGDLITAGRYDIWIERSNNRNTDQARFLPGSNDPTATISIPGTARRVITVGSYVTRNGAVGQISDFSSRGPTRYGLQKPELAAPGESIASARSSAAVATAAFNKYYTLNAGTSMAAPHVTGAAALLLEVNPALHCLQIRQLLARAASRSGFAASAPDNAWGAGKLNVEAAIGFARTVRFAAIRNVVVHGSAISWETDALTTGAVRFNTHRRRMLLGRASGSLSDLTPSLQHTIDLQGQPAGTYACEIVAFTQDDWETLDDNGGAHYTVTI